MNSKRLYKTAAVILAGMTLAGCASNTQAQSYNYAVNADTLSMKIGSSYKVKATGSDASKVKWTSSDQDVASIDTDGKITAIAEGQTIITAKVKKESVDVTLTVLGTKNKQKKDVVVVKDGKTSSYNSMKAVKTDISDYKIKLSKTSYEYDGKAKKPTVTVTAKDGTKLKLNKDYKVTYQANKNVGSAKAIAKGIKKYTGEVEYTFKIVAAKKVETPAATTDQSSTSDNASASTSTSTTPSTTSQSSSSSSNYTPRRRTTSSSSSSTSSTPRKRVTSSSSSSTKKSTSSSTSSSRRSNTSASTKKPSSTSSYSSTKSTTTPKKNTNNASSSTSSSTSSASNANSSSETNASNAGSSHESAVTSSSSSDTAASASGANITESTVE